MGASPLCLGHVAIICPESDKPIAFFRDFLGFLQTDDIAGIVNFLIVNVVTAPDSWVHHIAYELKDGRPIRQRRRYVARAGVNPLWAPRGHNVVAYHYNRARSNSTPSWGIFELNACGADFGFNLAAG